MLKKTASFAALAATVALAIPVAGLADGGKPKPQQPTAGRVARILERIAKVEARLAVARHRLAEREQKLAERCNTLEPTPAANPAGGDGQTAAPAASHVDRCARAKARLERVGDRLQKLQARLDKVKSHVQQWLQKHGGQAGGAGSDASGSDGNSSLSAADQQALDELQQQLEGVQN